jgi:hypothetical protein
MEEGQIDLHADRPEVASSSGVFDRSIGVLRLKATDDCRATIARLNHSSEEARPFFFAQVGAFTHRSGDLDHGRTGRQAL